MRPEELTYPGRDGAFSDGVCASAAEVADDSGERLGAAELLHQRADRSALHPLGTERDDFLSSRSLFSVSQRRFEYEGVKYDKPRFERNEIDAAGERLRLHDLDEKSVEIINNHRASHSYPLLIFRTVLTRRAPEAAVIAQRLKRLSSIQFKLEHNRRVRLSTIQDVGGCRAVLPSVGSARKLFDAYLSGSSKSKFLWKQDYVTEPRSVSGYRGFHLIYEFHGIEKAYNGLKLEIQLRSKPQHAWATAVETVGAFTKQALKSNIGDPGWVEFFKLMSSYMALEEHCPCVEGTPTTKRKLKAVIREHANDLKVIENLTYFGQITSDLETNPIFKVHGRKKATYFLLELRPAERQIFVAPYEAHDLGRAEADYLVAERRIFEGQNGGAEAVLVSATTIRDLKKAYPNYFGDTKVFIDQLGDALA